jgi:hypothetical protein
MIEGGILHKVSFYIRSNISYVLYFFISGNARKKPIKIDLPMKVDTAELTRLLGLAQCW